MNIVKELLLQQFIALMPFVMYNIYYRDKMKNYNRKFIILTSMVCLFLSMTLGTGAIPGFFYDSRFIIIFFGLVFGGLWTGVLLLFEFVLYRLYIGGSGWLPAMVTMSVAFPLSILLCKIYEKAINKSFVIVSSGLVISILPLATVYIHNPDDVLSNLMFHIVIIPVLNASGIWLLIGLFQRAVSNKELFITYAQNEKMNVVSHVAASLVHEVRNPLTTVKGFLQLIRESALERSKVEHYIRICETEIQRTDSILSEYLSISKPITERLEPINLYELLLVILDVMTPYANMNNVQLVMDVAAEKVDIYANSDKFKQILINFIKNSIEACSGLPNSKVILQLYVLNKRVMIKIIDNGIGMSEEQVSRLGTIYFSTKTRGTGLGLTYSYQMIRNLGGTIDVSSQPQAGTQFTIELPVYSPATNSVNL